ncbi:hypothetical protein ABKN59_001119 [Abortiporus biennis]
MTAEPPPTYSQNAVDHCADSPTSVEPHILIVPGPGSIGFQKGYLGADLERATIEGELQIKGGNGRRWGKVTIALRTTEKVDEHEINLNSFEMTLHSATEGSDLPSSYPFSIPLPPDTPQCLHSPMSSLTHTLTATFHPSDPDGTPLVKSLIIHTRRYTSHSHLLGPAPEIRMIDDPTHVEVQVPRTSFKAGESIPLYITIPSPHRELILDQGLRLRNVRAELVRIVTAKPPTAQGREVVADNYTSLQEAGGSNSASVRKQQNLMTSHPRELRAFLGVPGGGEVVALSGASCRLHPSKALRIRLVLHQPVSEEHLVSSPLDVELSEARQDGTTECATISQETILHSTSFVLCIHITFMHMQTHTERVSTISIPVAILPPSAPLPEVEESIDTAYHKKHDRPPTRTVREEDGDAPHYESEAGPSYIPNGAPPPFEEREAPPPFFTSEPEASTSRLPTFLESETEIYVPSQEEIVSPLPMSDLAFEGEGVLFGFTVSEQFDGYNHEHERPVTPPPTLEMATLDPDVTNLATMTERDAITALGLALEHHQEANAQPPPPPPPMDDPSDPPPSIDSAFRSPHLLPSSSPPHAPPAFTEPLDPGPSLPPPTLGRDTSDGHAPPPYNIPGVNHHSDHNNVTRPPPYVD